MELVCYCQQRTSSATLWDSNVDLAPDPLNLGLIGRQKRFRARAGRENRHESGYIFG
jgi:hypothetical protein